MKSIFVIALSFVVAITANQLVSNDNIEDHIELKLPKDLYNNYMAIMNAYMDVICIQVGPFLNQYFLPLPLPDVTEGFEYKPIFITYHGELILTNGEFHSIHSVARSSNAIMTYNNVSKLLSVGSEAKLRNLGFTYDYSASIMNLGPSGWVDVEVNSMTFAADFMIDLNTFYIYMQDFRLTKMGGLSVHFRGNILIDWLANILSDIITTLFKGLIKDIITASLRDFIQEVLDQMNSVGRPYSPEDVNNLLSDIIMQKFQVPMQNFNFK